MQIIHKIVTLHPDMKENFLIRECDVIINAQFVHYNNIY